MALRTHNLITNETAPATHPPTLEQFLLLHRESPDDVSTIAANWTKTYPGENHLITSLRQDLIRAEFHRNRALTTFDHLEFDLHSTGLPMHHWDKFTVRHYKEFDTLKARAQRDFLRALRFLQSIFTAAQPKASAKPAEPLAPPPPIRSKNTIIVEQTARIEIIDGKVVTRTTHDAAHWLRTQVELADVVKCYRRHYFFPERIVPDQYAHVLTHLGVTYEPARSVFIFYTAAEFMRLCQLEIDTNSEFLIDGERIASYHDNR